MNAPNVTVKVAKRFQELRRRYLTVRLGILAAAAVSALMLLWMVLATCDYLWEWSITWRKAGLLVGAVAILMAVGHRCFALARDTRQRRFAAQLEHTFEEFGQRIRTVLDTVDGRVKGPREMLTALGHQTLGRWETLTPAQLIPSRSLATLGAVCLLTLVVAAGMFIRGGDLRTAMRRALGQQVPYTELTVTPGDARLLEGAPVELSLELTGRTNRDVMLRYRHLEKAEAIAPEDAPGATDSENEPAHEWTESELLPNEPGEGEQPDERRARFSTGLGKADQAIEYQFVTSVGTTRVYRVDVQPLIQAERIETQVEPPAYTRLETRAFATTSVTVLEQSKVNVTIETNHPLREAQLAVGEKRSKLKSIGIQTGDDPRQWTFELPSTESLHWRFTGAGNDGTPMTPVKGRLRVRRDAGPNVAWRDPPDEVRVHTLAELPMRVQVSDDYGISEVGVVFQLGGDDEYVLDDWVAEDPETATTNTTRKTLEQILPLESFALSERDFISYYAYAIDNRASGQQRSESDVRYIDIRPLRQFYAEIERDPNNANDADSVLVQLDEIIRRQRFLINRTRRLLRSSSVDLADQLGAIDRMVESQSELAGLTRFLAEFFVARGNDDVEALNQAEAAMLQAADSLAAGSFDLALVQEQDALRALAEARRTLEVFLLKNPTLQQRQAFRRLARQLRQKLRRERPETEQQLADTLQRIASEQMQLGQMSQRIMNSTNMNGGGVGGKPNPENEQGGTSGASAGQAETDTKSPENAAESTEQTDASNDTENPEGKPRTSGDNADPAEPDDADASRPQGGENDRENDGRGNEMNDIDSDEPSLEEQQAELFARQTDLLERVQAVEDELSDRLASSPLMDQRMKEVKESMDELATQARDEELKGFASVSQETADQLREIATQLDALAAAEPVSRVSAIRDMTTSLANMESQLANQQQQQSQQGQGRDGQTGQDGRGGRSDSDTESDTARLARRLQRRTETIEDILKAPVDVGDVETSEVNDMLERFVDETEFLQQLESTRNAAQQIAENQSGDQSTGNNEPTEDSQAVGSRNDDDESEEGMARAMEYAAGARMLDELYRQLVTPRLARLQRIEQQVTQLAQRVGGEGGKQNEDDPETRLGIRMLQNDLEEEGLGELAEILSETEMTEEELQAELAMRFHGGKGAVAFNPSAGRWANRLLLISAELQARIQEMILLEISADRDAPVPAEYRKAVDRYFRTLSGDADTIDSPHSPAIGSPAVGGRPAVDGRPAAKSAARMTAPNMTRPSATTGSSQ